MLASYLKSLPAPKFILIEDSINARGCQFVESVLKNSPQKLPIHYCVYQGSFSRKPFIKDCIYHDFSSNSEQNFENLIKDLATKSVIVIDSLAHFLYEYGISETVKRLTLLKKAPHVHQIISQLHLDLLVNGEQVVPIFEHLATLHLALNGTQVSYTFKKSIRKIIKQIEEYSFENENLVTRAIQKALKPVVPIEETNPATLSTFKISLSDRDKESRDNLILPYLPPADDEPKIHYNFDELDDWDEEDPDDDLDI